MLWFDFTLRLGAPLADPERILVARVVGTASDGGPIFASLKPETIAWELASA